ILPLTVAEKDSPDDSKTLYYNVTVRQPYTDEYALHDGHDLFFVFYINTNDYQPLLAQDYIMRKKLARGTTVAWYDAVGNIINLRTVVLDYDAATGRALLNLGNDMRYVLDHTVKYIRPLQEHGSKVCISLEGGGSGLGFCNLTDEQIADFVAQVKAVIENYELDGINLWDRNA
ncbi:endo-beta-N-acetylglucosaminidase H, partial [human gut metagenome]